LEQRELDYRSPWQSLQPTVNGQGQGEPHQELGRVTPSQGDRLSLEICFSEAIPPSSWAGMVDIVLWRPETHQILLRSPLDEATLARAQRQAEGRCVVLARQGELSEGGPVAVEAVWTDHPQWNSPRELRLQAHLWSYSPSTSSQHWSVVLVLVGTILFTLLVARGEESSVIPPPKHRPELAPLLVACLLLFAAQFAVGYLPVPGSLGGLVRALALAVTQMVLVLALWKVARRNESSLGLWRTPRPAWALWVAPLIGLLLWLGAQVALHWVPSTGESVVTTMVAWPSGALAVALAGVCVPVTEEVFFRGALFGGVERRWGGTAALVISLTAFSVAHLPQTWGAWGGMTAIVLAGLGFSLLRLWTGSVAPAALAHLAYNATVALGGVLY
jgi:membrane protease YdiL (CAAX protease family)